MSISTIDSPNHVLSLILYIGRRNGQYASQLVLAGFPRPALYSTLNYLTKVGILKDSFARGEGRGGIRRVFDLTPLGQKIYTHLEAIDKLLR
jgi:DNA-binding PadR family transcriptional regulator